MAVLTEDDIFTVADAIELAMETQPMGFGWTPSAVARKCSQVAIGTEVRRPTTTEAYTVLCWLVDHVYITSDGRGAWTKYFRRH